MADDSTDTMSLTLKAPGKGKSGLVVERRGDGHYYIQKKPRGMKGCKVGDRVVEINGVKFPRFKNEKHANDLIDTFQLDVIPLDEEEDDESSDSEGGYEEVVRPSAAAKSVPVGGKNGRSPTPQPASSRAAPTKSAAGKNGKKGRGRREEVEYLDSDDDGDDEGARPTSHKKDKSAGLGSAPAAKKGRGRREEVEYLDSDDDSDDEGARRTSHKKDKSAGLGSAPAAKKGRGRREEVEHLDSDDDTSGEDEDHSDSLGQNENRGRSDEHADLAESDLDDVEISDPDDDVEGGARSKSRQTLRERMAAASRKNEGSQDSDDENPDDYDEDDSDDDDDDDDESEDRKEVAQSKRGSRSAAKNKLKSQAIEDDDDGDDDDDDDDDIDDGEESDEKVDRKPRDRATSNGLHQVPDATTGSEHEVSEYGAYDDESIEADDDEDPGVFSDDATISDEEDDSYSRPPKPLSGNSLKHSLAKKRDSRHRNHPSQEDWDRPYTSDYVPMDRWMVTVKRDEDEDVGLTLVQHKKELFVADVDRGPFFKTAMDKGDKVLSICGKKIPKHIQTVAEAEALMEGKSTLTMFVLRPDPEKDVGYKWVMENV